MVLLPPSSPSFIQKHWKIIIPVVVFVILAGIVIWAVSRAHTRARDLEKLSQINTIRNALNSYFYFRNDYPPVGGVTKDKNLGAGDAVCLDKSDEGLRGLCDKDQILRQIPSGYVYKKTSTGNFVVKFNLEKPVGSLSDVNKDGKIECRATREGIECH